MKLGIDFGTSYTSASFLRNEQIRFIKDPINQLSNSIPSSIYVAETGDILIGQAAENRKRRDPYRYQNEFKRDLGTTTPYQLGQTPFLPEDLIAEMLCYIKLEAEKIVGQPVEEAVLTIPATYQEYKKQIMAQAGQKAGFQKISLLAEPVAAAVYYAAAYPNGLPNQKEETLLVYDFGGGTFDTALLRHSGSHYEFLGVPAGLADVGGTDFNRLIMDHLISTTGPALEALLSQSTPFARQLQVQVEEACQKVKHQLSVTSEHEEMLVLPAEPVFYQLTRQEFNQMIAPLVENTLAVCRQMVQSAGIEYHQIDRVLLVGGSCRVPYIEQAVKQEFDRPIVRADDLELVVSNGAAYYQGEFDSVYTTKVARPQAAKKLVVSKTAAPGKFLSIEQALQEATPGTLIQIEPGVYNESLVIEKDVRLEASGKPGETAIHSVASPCITIKTEQISITGLALHFKADPKEPGELADTDCALYILQGRPTIERCQVSAENGMGVVIDGPNTQPNFQQCRCHHTKWGGMVFQNESKGSVEDCDFEANENLGLATTGNASPTVTNCRIQENEGLGVYSLEKGQGVFKDCSITSNKLSNVMSTSEAELTFQNCAIQQGKDAGVVVQENGKIRLLN